MEPMDGPETSVSHHLTPRSNAEDGRIQFICGGGLPCATGFPSVFKIKRDLQEKNTQLDISMH
jgi:hypothetical protein